MSDCGNLQGQICRFQDIKYGDFVNLMGIQSEPEYDKCCRRGAATGSLVLSFNSVTKIYISSFTFTCFCRLELSWEFEEGSSNLFTLDIQN